VHPRSWRAVWTGKDDNTPMKRVTGGGAPAEIWRTFMAAALPRLNAQTIPGGEPQAAAEPDAIGDMLDGQTPPAPVAPVEPAQPQPAPTQPEPTSPPF